LIEYLIDSVEQLQMSCSISVFYFFICERKYSMADIIRLLPDNIANQIAAGEVIQRPASAVKELLENAVDAGATLIKLFIKDAGKQLIMISDNGSGMSDTDARMSFERHATSKLKTADDLFNITTKGFRGEALASIAAIAQVELKSKQAEAKVGTRLQISGSEFEFQEPVACSDGTSIAVKNLFYNTPARRNFLKSNSVETSHILEEFQRVALAHPEISFSYFIDDNEIMKLEGGNLRKRLVAILGNSYNEKLVPLELESTIVTISGFVVKPEFSRKTRGEQYFFLNNRFIKNSYLHHAVQGAYADLLPDGSHPSYFINLTVNPQSIDVNIHPTKTEVKFEDEKSIYAILRSCVKQSLGKYNVAPSLSFENESSLEFTNPPKAEFIKAPTIKIDTTYNPFSSSNASKMHRHSNFEQEGSEREQNNIRHAASIYEGLPERESEKQQLPVEQVEQEKFENPTTPAFQIGTQFIITKIKSGMVIIDQQLAAERILFEKHLKNIRSQNNVSQQLLFPQTIDLSPSEFVMLTEFMSDLKLLGFEMEEFGQNTFVIRGIPSNVNESEVLQTLHYLLENIRNGESDISLVKNERMARLMAQNLSLKSKRALSQIEIQSFINDLFSCENPFYTPTGKSTLVNLSLDEIATKFK
jgi:DNA mismatch repair protein MutL